MIVQEMRVAAIKNGTVIDHIPSEKLFQVVNLLQLEKMEAPVTIGFNLRSDKMQKKSIIKVVDKFFSDEELNQLSVVAPNVTLCIIRDYKVVEKKPVTMPEELINVVKCANPKCICNNEPMKTRFRVLDKQEGILQCHYCNKELLLQQVKLL